MAENKLKILREKKGLMQYQLAQKARIHPSIISLTEHGLDPSERVKSKIAKALDCEKEKIFPEKE